jgi:heat shock protein HtpX
MRRPAGQIHTALNLAHTVVLFAGLVLLLAAAGYFLGGLWGVITAVVGVGVLILFAPSISPRVLLRMYGATPVSAALAPELHALVRELAQRAALPRVPQLYYVPSQLTNAFAVGSRADAAIGITDGLLRRLSLRELAGVLAHELSHIRHNDLWVMNVADTISRVTSLLANGGQLLLFLNLPLLLAGQRTISWLGILLLLAAPLLSGLLQLALSRTREFDADLGAIGLTSDPAGLASALLKLERDTAALLRQMMLPGDRVAQPSILRTHPATSDRVARLRQLASDQGQSLAVAEEQGTGFPEPLLPVQPRRPQWHIMGLWF